MPSFHQDGLFKALLASVELDLRVVFAAEAPAHRLQLGWMQAARDYPNRMLSTRFAFWDAVRIAWSERGRLHIVNGIWAEPSFAAALCVLAFARSRFVVYAEAPDPRQTPVGFRGALRRWFGGWIAKRARGMLAVSHFGEQFYTRLGFDGGRVYQFGYFRANNNWPKMSATQSTWSKRIEVIFVGQLIDRKGVDLLMEAVQPLLGAYPDLLLSVIGSGNEAQALQDRARALRMADRVKLADVLVLPSRWDGWGMVVNEAFSVGVPVIVSDRCGAADLVQNGINGYVFQSGDVADLRRCLGTFLDRTTDWPRFRNAAASTGDRISAEAAAPYLIDCLRHMTGKLSERPTPPWAQSSALGDVA